MFSMMITSAKPFLQTFSFLQSFMYIAYNDYKNYTRSHMGQSKIYITEGQF